MLPKFATPDNDEAMNGTICKAEAEFVAKNIDRGFLG